MKPIIAMDFDGVMIADVRWNESEEDYYDHCFFQKPIFNPDFPYYIITGRESKGAKEMRSWFASNTMYIKQPFDIYSDNIDWKKSAEYKAGILNKNPHIKIFIESNAYEAERIQGLLNTNCMVVTFPEFIVNAMWNLQDYLCNLQTRKEFEGMTTLDIEEL